MAQPTLEQAMELLRRCIEIEWGDDLFYLKRDMTAWLKAYAERDEVEPCNCMEQAKQCMPTSWKCVKCGTSYDAGSHQITRPTRPKAIEPLDPDKYDFDEVEMVDKINELIERQNAEVDA